MTQWAALRCSYCLYGKAAVKQITRPLNLLVTLTDDLPSQIGTIGTNWTRACSQAKLEPNWNEIGTIGTKSMCACGNITKPSLIDDFS